MSFISSKYVKHILSVVCIITMFICYHFIVNKANKTSLINNRKDSYKGILTELYRNVEDHNILMMRIDTSGFRPLNRNAQAWGISVDNINLGDSIIKLPGTLMIIIKKPDGSSKEFFYRQ